MERRWKSRLCGPAKKPALLARPMAPTLDRVRMSVLQWGYEEGRSEYTMRLSRPDRAIA